MPLTESRKLHFGINNCRDLDLYDKLKFEHGRLKETMYKEKYDVFNFIVTAYHLHEDWLKRDMKRPVLANKKKNKVPKEMKQIIDATRDLANGNKHMLLDDHNFKRKVVDTVHPPEIRGSYFSWCYCPHIGVSIGTTYYSLPTLADLIMSYFDWMFDDSIPADEFPVKIQESLARAIAIAR